MRNPSACYIIAIMVWFRRKVTFMKKFGLVGVLHLLLALFSLSTVCSKLAGRQPLFSLPFILYYGLVIVILGIYAIGWQQIIKRLPLTYAYANKAVTVVWGMIWGVLIFNEKISVQRGIGAVVIIAGIILFAFSEEKPSEKEGVEVPDA